MTFCDRSFGIRFSSFLPHPLSHSTLLHVLSPATDLVHKGQLWPLCHCKGGSDSRARQGTFKPGSFLEFLCPGFTVSAGSYLNTRPHCSCTLFWTKQQVPFHLDQVDIYAPGQEASQKYMFDVPVVELNGRVAMMHRIDEPRLVDILRKEKEKPQNS